MFTCRVLEEQILIDEELDIGVALEFGVSSVTLMSLMELGLSRMSAVALYEKIVSENLDKEGCLAWIRERAPHFEGMIYRILSARKSTIKCS